MLEQDDNDRLKPCAHCGGDGVVSQMESGAYFIQCTNALCGMSTVEMYATGDNPVPILMEKWNRRAAKPKPDERGSEPDGWETKIADALFIYRLKNGSQATLDLLNSTSSGTVMEVLYRKIEAIAARASAGKETK